MMAALLDLSQKLWWSVDDIVDETFCAHWIERSEHAPREVATINAPGGPLLDPNTRNNTRLIVDDEAVAAALWPAVKPHVPPVLNRWQAVGLNERLRLYRYEGGQRFGPHYDGAFVRNEDERSMLTLLLYLDGDCVGGETNLLDLGEAVAPRPGRALFFQHPILHEGAPVERGLKHVLRTDVMYRRPQK